MSFLLNPFIFTPTTNSVISLTDLVAYYNMNDNVLGQSGNGYNGTLSGTTTYVNSPVSSGFGKAVSLTAATTGHVTVPYTADWNGADGNKLSVFCRIKRNATGDMTFVDRWTTWRLMARTAAGDILVRAGEGTASISSQNPGVGVNAHIGFTYDGSNIRVYKNGAQVGSNVAASGIMSGTENLWIGRQHGGTNQYLSGDIDEVIIYKRVLTAAEIAAIYSATTGLIY